MLLLALCIVSVAYSTAGVVLRTYTTGPGIDCALAQVKTISYYPAERCNNGEYMYKIVGEEVELWSNAGSNATGPDCKNAAKLTTYSTECSPDGTSKWEIVTEAPGTTRNSKITRVYSENSCTHDHKLVMLYITNMEDGCAMNVDEKGCGIDATFGLHNFRFVRCSRPLLFDSDLMAKTAVMASTVTMLIVGAMGLVMLLMCLCLWCICCTLRKSAKKPAEKMMPMRARAAAMKIAPMPQASMRSPTRSMRRK